MSLIFIIICFIAFNIGSSNSYKLVQSVSSISPKNDINNEKHYFKNQKGNKEAIRTFSSCGIVPATNIPLVPGPGNVGARHMSYYGQIPWQVGIFTHNSFLCSGVLISELHVITAAICVFGVEDIENSVELRLGDWDISGSTNTVYEPYKYYSSFPTSVTIIPDADLLISGEVNAKSPKLAIFTLDRPVNYNLYPQIRPICLPEYERKLAQQKQSIVFVSGWGPQDPKDTFKFQKVSPLGDDPLTADTVSARVLKVLLKNKNAKLSTNQHAKESMGTRHEVIRSPTDNSTTPPPPNDSTVVIIHEHPEPNPISFSLPVFQLPNQKSLYHALNPNDLLNSSEIFTESDKELEHPKYAVITNASSLLDPLNHHELPDDLLFRKTNESPTEATQLTNSVGNQSLETNTGKPQEVHRRQENSNEEIAFDPPQFSESYLSGDDLMFRHKQKYKTGKHKGAQEKQITYNNNKNEHRPQEHYWSSDENENQEKDDFKREIDMFSPIQFEFDDKALPKYTSTLKWTNVKYYPKCPNLNHDIMSPDIQFGSGCLHSKNLDESKSFCLIDLGSPISKTEHLKPGLEQATLIGIVTWKKPCPTDYVNEMDEADSEIGSIPNSTLTIVIDILEFMPQIRKVMNKITIT